MDNLRSIAPALGIDRTPARPSSGNVTLLPPSAARLNAATEDALLLLMAQTSARYPKQEMLPLTTDMYLAEWEQMVLRYGLDPFRDALSRAIHNRARAPFFPEPHEIEEEIRAELSARRNRAVITSIDEARQRWERENGRRAVTAADLERAGRERCAGPVQRSPPPARHTDEEIAARMADLVTPEQREAVRERMASLATVADPT